MISPQFSTEILIKLYNNNSNILSEDYYRNFRLLYHYLTGEYSGYKRIPNNNNYPHIKWYERNQSVYIVSEILKISPEELLFRLKELNHEHR